MLFRISLSAAIILTGATLGIERSIAATKTSVEIGNTARSITVLIKSDNNQGSGVILQQQGDIYTVLTAAHAIKKNNTYKITTSDDRQHEIIANSFRRVQGIDLAVVRFKSTAKYPIAKLGNCNLLQSGMDVYVAGFPLATRVLTESILVFREGKVSANSNKTFEDGYSLIYSNDTLPGMSGGAVLNSEGEVVAIHGRGDREEGSDGKIGQKTGFNVGIPINRFATVAKNLGVELDVAIAPIPQNAAPKADDYIAAGRQKYGRKDYRGALADYDTAIGLNPNIPAVYNYRGNLKSNKLKDYRGALADFNRAIELDPQNTAAYGNRAFLKEDKFKDYRGALIDYDRSIQLDPKNAISRGNRGYLRAMYLKDLRGGLDDLDRAIAIAPNNAFFYNDRGTIKGDKLNDISGSLADIQRSIELNPNQASFYVNRGFIVAIKMGDPRAVSDFNKAISLDPNNLEAHNNRGYVSIYMTRDYRSGLADINRAIQIDPNYPNPYKHRGYLKANHFNDLRGGLADLDRAIQLDPNYPEALKERGVTKLKLGENRSGAIADLRQAAALFQDRGNAKEYRSVMAILNRYGEPLN